MPTTKKPLDAEENHRSLARQSKPGILSLVNALNATMLVRTIVGYQAQHQTTRARRRKFHTPAVVRFEICPGTEIKKVHALLDYVFFYGLRIERPVRIGIIHHTFATRQDYYELTIRPAPGIVDTARNLWLLTDFGIGAATKLIGEASKPDAMKQFSRDRAKNARGLARRAKERQPE